MKIILAIIALAMPMLATAEPVELSNDALLIIQSIRNSESRIIEKIDSDFDKLNADLDKVNEGLKEIIPQMEFINQQLVEINEGVGKVDRRVKGVIYIEGALVFLLVIMLFVLGVRSIK